MVDHKERSREELIIDQVQNSSLCLDDKFRFHCRTCGKCCKNREDILLTARDLFNIAVCLELTPAQVMERYCDIYIGDASRIPVVRLRPVGPEMTCPLLQDKRCLVHRAKPVVCALYPLGRVAMKQTDTEAEPETVYIFQNPECGSSNRQYTVRSWLDKFNIPINDEFFRQWTKCMTYLCPYMAKMERQGIGEASLDLLWNVTLRALYIEYDTHQELLPQFMQNFIRLKNAFTQIEKIIAEESVPRGGEALGAN